MLLFRALRFLAYMLAAHNCHNSNTRGLSTLFWPLQTQTYTHRHTHTDTHTQTQTHTQTKTDTEIERSLKNEIRTRHDRACHRHRYRLYFKINQKL